MSIDKSRQNQCSVKSHESQDHFDGSPAMVSINVYITNDGHTKYLQNNANKFGRKMGFKIENEAEDQGQLNPHYKGS